jgi:hypothetical protein
LLDIGAHDEGGLIEGESGLLTPRPRDEIEAQYAKAERMRWGNRRDRRSAIATETVIAVTAARTIRWRGCSAEPSGHR